MCPQVQLTHLGAMVALDRGAPLDEVSAAVLGRQLGFQFVCRCNATTLNIVGGHLPGVTQFFTLNLFSKDPDPDLRSHQKRPAVRAPQQSSRAAAAAAAGLAACDVAGMQGGAQEGEGPGCCMACMGTSAALGMP